MSLVCLHKWQPIHSCLPGKKEHAFAACTSKHLPASNPGMTGQSKTHRLPGNRQGVKQDKEIPQPNTDLTMFSGKGRSGLHRRPNKGPMPGTPQTSMQSSQTKEKLEAEPATKVMAHYYLYATSIGRHYIASHPTEPRCSGCRLLRANWHHYKMPFRTRW